MNLKQIIQEIESDDNQRRKAEHQKRQHVYNDYQRPYVLKMLTQEFSSETVSEMRTCTSINLTKRIIQLMASLYQKCPDRSFTDVTPDQHEGIERLYAAAKADTRLKRTNQKYKLHDQCALQVLPMDGHIGIRVLHPGQYDVIPDPQNPERPLAYIISAFDRIQLDQQSEQDVQGNYYGSKNEQQTDGANQEIADKEDYIAAIGKYVIWTVQENILCDKNGVVLQRNPNPIGMLPFIDVASDKDFEFWVRKGSGVVEFALDFSLVISDTVNTNRLQSYSQAIIVAEKPPENVVVGPQNIIFLPIDPARPEVKPSFEFANPSPDMKASLELQDRLLSYFLTAQGIDPKAVSSNKDAANYSSGLERLLAMIERFEVSQDDMDLFRDVEDKLYSLMRAWYLVTNNTTMLDAKYNFGAWPENSEIMVNFSGPEMVRTQAEKEDSTIKLLENGLISKEEAIMELRGVDQDKAKEILSSIDQQNQPEA